MKIRNLFKFAARGGLGVASTVLSILSIPQVRDFLWNKVLNKGKSKIVDVQAKVVQEEKKGWF
ncbi:MAG: hypothetical protein WCT24_01305 [Patescibacteria group bacterium]|jgi:hypothetical protein